MKRKVAKKFPPCVFIKEELEARGWTDADLAEKALLTPTGVREILAGHRKITPIFDLCLANAFGVSKGFFMNLQKSYDEK